MEANKGFKELGFGSKQKNQMLTDALQAYNSRRSDMEGDGEMVNQGDQMPNAQFADSIDMHYGGKKNSNRDKGYFSLDFDKAKLVNDPDLENRAEY